MIPPTPLNHRHEIFHKEYPSGEMDMETFIKENMYVHGGDADLWQYLFKVLDNDESGKVDFGEFICALAVGTKGSVDEKLKWAFHIYDIDNNGYIEEKEMEKLLGGILKMAARSVDNGELDVTEEEVKQKSKQIFERMDTDGDGHLTLEEFILGCKEDQKLVSAMNAF